MGVLAKALPRRQIDAVLGATGTASRRERKLPAHVVVYYIVALGLYLRTSCAEVLAELLEGLRYVTGRRVVEMVASRGGITRARSRLGPAPLRALFAAVVRPVAVQRGAHRTRGAWYRRWRLVAVDGSTLEVPDTSANLAAFGRPRAARGQSAYPQLRFVGLVEGGTHLVFAAEWGAYPTSEGKLAEQLWPRLRANMLCLADRGFLNYAHWQQARASGAALVWRLKQRWTFPRLAELPDGSYLSRLYPTAADRHHDRHGVPVRVIEYQLRGVADAEPVYRLVTSILDPTTAPAAELAALYPHRWEIELTLGEVKTHLRGGRGVTLRSKTPALVEQEFYGLLLAHYAVRLLMHEAARQADESPHRLSFTHAVHIVRRKLAGPGAFFFRSAGPPPGHA
jgi:hypothetical protein